jgi:murein L,D-transpeptidase YafK
MNKYKENKLFQAKIFLLAVLLSLVYVSHSMPQQQPPDLFRYFRVDGKPVTEIQIPDATRGEIVTFTGVWQDWLEQWKAQDLERYMPFYHSSFYSNTSRQDYEAWRAHKVRVFRPNRRVQVTFTDMIFSYQENEIRFEATQDYRAGTYNDYGKKTILWQRENGVWTIRTEDWVAMRREIVTPDIPPVEIEIPKPDTLRPIWEARVGQVPFEYINFLFRDNYDPTAPYLFVVEKVDQYAGLYKFDTATQSHNLLHTYFVSTGQNQGNKVVRGDLKTPEGLYFTTRFIPESALEERFGTGAFVLDYPNELDRVRRKTGSGIWIHGSDIEMTPFDTEGCIRFENEDILYFRNTLGISRGTPVIINNVLEWTDIPALRAEVDNIVAFIQSWKTDWENQNIDKYLAYYSSTEFVTHRQSMDYSRWAAHKQRVFSVGNRVSLTLTGFRYHYADDLLLVTFYQDYSAGSYADFGKKQLVLRRNSGDWKIIQEEWAPLNRR